MLGQPTRRSRLRAWMLATIIVRLAVLLSTVVAGARYATLLLCYYWPSLEHPVDAPTVLRWATATLVGGLLYLTLGGAEHALATRLHDTT